MPKPKHGSKRPTPAPRRARPAESLPMDEVEEYHAKKAARDDAFLSLDGRVDDDDDDDDDEEEVFNPDVRDEEDDDDDDDDEED